MDINHLRYFAAIAEAGGMRQAAELLKLSPSGLSRSVAQLEAGLGRSLFARAGRGVELTDDGRRLYALSRRLIDDYEHLHIAMREGSSRPPLFSVGSFEVFTTYFFGEVAGTMFKDAQVRLLELPPGDIEEALTDRRIDLGITYAPAPRPDLDFLRVGKFAMGIFARKGAFEGVPPQELPFVVPISTLRGSVVGFKSLDGWPDDRFPRKTAFQCELLESALELARRGVAALHCPAFIVRLHNRHMWDECHLVERPLPKGMRQVEMTAYIAKRKSDPEGHMIKSLAKAMRVAFRRTEM